MSFATNSLAISHVNKKVVAANIMIPYRNPTFMLFFVVFDKIGIEKRSESKTGREL